MKAKHSNGNKNESAFLTGTRQGKKKTCDLVDISKIDLVFFCWWVFFFFLFTSHHLMFAGRGRGNLWETRLPPTHSTSHTSEVMVLGVNHFLWQQSREEPWCEVTSRASAVSLCCHCWIRWWPARAEDIQRRWLSSASPKHMLSPGVSARPFETLGEFDGEGPSHFQHYPSQSKGLSIYTEGFPLSLLATMPRAKGK